MLKFIFFDLDGTLLPMNQDEFTDRYFAALTKFFVPLGHDPKQLKSGIWKGIAAMVKNDGGATNEEVFWHTYTETFGPKAADDKKIFDEFYKTAFNGLKEVCTPTPVAAQIVGLLKAKGYKLVLASNPIFPEVGQKNRINWAGVSADDFVSITSYENSRHCKPNPEYYRAILQAVGANADECLMVGNDVNEDMVAEEVGMKVFLMTDCLLNKSGADVSRYPRGSFSHLLDYLENNH